MIPLPVNSSTDQDIAEFVALATREFGNGLLAVAQAGTGMVVFAAVDGWGKVVVLTDPDIVRALFGNTTEH